MRHQCNSVCSRLIISVVENGASVASSRCYLASDTTCSRTRERGDEKGERERERNNVFFYKRQRPSTSCSSSSRRSSRTRRPACSKRTRRILLKPRHPRDQGRPRACTESHPDSADGYGASSPNLGSRNVRREGPADSAQ